MDEPRDSKGRCEMMLAFVKLLKERERKFYYKQPPIGEKDDDDSENSWISDGLPSSRWLPAIYPPALVWRTRITNSLPSSARAKTSLKRERERERQTEKNRTTGSKTRRMCMVLIDAKSPMGTFRYYLHASLHIRCLPPNFVWHPRPFRKMCTARRNVDDLKQTCSRITLISS
jgi:hypothetical protein